MNKRLYPFIAMVGMEEVKKALILNMINPKIGGVLLAGEKGTAKSTIVRALAQLMKDKNVVTLPLGTTEDGLLGTVNIEEAMNKGKRVFEPGILGKAHNNILYIDEVNLLSETLINMILDVAVSGVNKVEREGISYEHPCEFILIGTMNPEEGKLNPQLLDRFGFYVEVKGTKEKEERIEIVKRRLVYEKDANTFYHGFLKDEMDLRERIVKAQKNLKNIAIDDDILEKIAKLNMQGHVQGHRGDLVLTRGAIAHTAFHEKNKVTTEEIKAVANITLGHRLREGNEGSGETKNQKEENEIQPDSPNQDPLEQGSEQPSPEFYPSLLDNRNEGKTNDQEQLEKNFHIGEAFDASGLLHSLTDRKIRKCGSGKRSKSKTSSKIGRYIGYKIPKNKVEDLSFDGTIRAAAPYQKWREKNGLAFVIRKEDIREKIREQRIGNTILFLVDASGSMGIEKRMVEAKGAIFSLLKDAYEKRDQVGMMTFRGNDASVVLQPTRSVDLAYRCLKDIKLGGKTPLALGLMKSVAYIKGLRTKDAEIMPVIVLLSDGRGNVGINSKDTLKEILSIAGSVKDKAIKFMVIDTEGGFLRLGLAKKLSDALGADYFRLEDIRGGLAQCIRKSSNF
ncbi:AAA family ATPase [Crassaminicella profunda]|uniref:AAA family ATPase n=1 Tax=Crassaminicella profunda TaxID=1286698 RepID=UPI001CA61A56|nr:AAA family ATPase [Crassaminicella profunda]QZY55863.1 AAA family ATPase [Crassaminicella profunda]